jgi:hypothetical protein
MERSNYIVSRRCARVTPAPAAFFISMSGYIPEALADIADGE